ncbi:hypothetical protein H0H81_005025 [Sphagnurus paluster]|uniref:Pentatricopeptide repeat-containing protein n=1 Tax=Sphagnurus paluster TaxID=117069 RepID=A0A9P7GMB3_9AGAR|nr:hypothetical protein H0H81_005025 [Sphagnurus paluster]
MIRNLAANCNFEHIHFSSRCAIREYATRVSRDTLEDAPRLPRYLRRQSIQPKPGSPQASESKVTPAQTRGEEDAPSSSQKVYRSRHFQPNPPQDPTAPKTEKRLLEPYILSTRLKKLCDTNKIDDAVSMLKNSPRDAQNTQVWNTLIWECMKAKRFNLSYSLYTDMKRRGFSPTARTFQTMFTGLSKIENWSAHPKQLDNSHSIYEAFQRYMASVKKHDPDSAELTSGPVAAYIKILGDNALYQEVFDVYYALPEQGPGSPNELVYTAMFHALASTPGNSPPELHYQNATNARTLWNQMQKSLQKSPSFTVDTYVVTAAIASLSRGRAPEIELAFSLVREYFGLRAPGDPPSKATLALSHQSLDVILRLCNSSQKYTLCTDFFQQVKLRPQALGGVDCLDHGHMNEVLRARIASPGTGVAYACLEILEWMLRQEIVGHNGFRIRPNMVSYNLVMTACWRDGDWRSAARVFDLMTGFHSHDFMDGAVAQAPRRDARGAGRSLDPSAETLNSMLRTALTSRDRANVRQCLRIFNHIQVEQMFIADKNTSKIMSKTKAYFTSKLASAVMEGVQFVLGTGAGGTSPPPETVSWRRLATMGTQFEKRMQGQKSIFIPTVMETSRTREERVH